MPGAVVGEGCLGGRMNVEQAVFLVGGLGSRLRALTGDTAKPVLDVGGRPFLDHLLDEASRHGIKRALLLCGYRAGDLVPRTRGRSIRGMTIETAVEPNRPAPPAPSLWPPTGSTTGSSWSTATCLFDFNWLGLCPPTTHTATGWVLAWRWPAASRAAAIGRVPRRRPGRCATSRPAGPLDRPINAGVYLMRKGRLPDCIAHRCPPARSSATFCRAWRGRA